MLRQFYTLGVCICFPVSIDQSDWRTTPVDVEWSDYSLFTKLLGLKSNERFRIWQWLQHVTLKHHSQSAVEIHKTDRLGITKCLIIRIAEHQDKNLRMVLKSICLYDFQKAADKGLKTYFKKNLQDYLQQYPPHHHHHNTIQKHSDVLHFVNSKWEST